MALFLFCAPAIHFEAVIENVKKYDGALPSLFRFSSETVETITTDQT